MLAIEPPRRLEISWAWPKDDADPAAHTRVTFEVEPVGPQTRLTVTHSDLVAGTDMDRGIRSGWPAVLSNLKSQLETGRPMTPEIWGAKAA